MRSPTRDDAAGGSSAFGADARGRGAARAGRGGARLLRGELADGRGIAAATSCTTGAGGAVEGACADLGRESLDSRECGTDADCLAAARAASAPRQGAPIVITISAATFPAGPGAMLTQAAGAGASGTAEECCGAAAAAGRSATAPRSGFGDAAGVGDDAAAPAAPACT